MRIRPLAALAAVAFALTACDSMNSGPATLDTDAQKASYALGQDLGRNLGSAGNELDMDALIKGFRDALADVDPQITAEEQQAAMMAFGESVQAARQADFEADATANLEKGQAYLAENGAKEGVITTESGLQYEVLTAGDGAMPTADQTVRIHYVGTLIDGTEFDSSVARGEPAEFGVSGVIPGFSEALQLMPVGSKYRIVIPSDRAYGPQGTGGAIGPNETLIFEIELIEIVGQG